jgi:3-oxoacyl-[acyl-carrier-protein] synthase-1
MLEKAEDAISRGAMILGEVLGAGCVTEAMGIVELRPDGDGLERAIRMALDTAGVSPDDVGLIVAHGNGNQKSDASEATALRRVFASAPPPITSFKWAFGHTIAASAIIDLAMVLQALRQKTVPGIATLKELDPAFMTLPISQKPQIPRSNVALICSRGFSSMNVALLVRATG